MDRIIRPWIMEDAADLAIALNNKQIQNNLRDGLPYPYTVADAENYIRAVLNAETDSKYAFAIVDDNRAVGSIGVFRKENIHRRTAEMGYYVAEPYWGKGICTNAVKEICGYVFEKTDIVRIFAEPFAHNAASCRVLEKARFIFEGTLRKNAIKNDEILDMKMYSLVKDF
jgi:RimJ/RimL family protein N-acetyltransferase